MDRRSLVCAGLSTLLVPVAGCGERVGTETTLGRTEALSQAETDATEMDSTTPKSEPTTTNRTVRQRADVRHKFGESHRVRDWAIAVMGLDLTTEFQRDGQNTTYKVDGDRQLGLVTARVTNVDNSRNNWSGWPIVLIVNGRVYENRLGFEHSSSENSLGLGELDRVEHVRRLYPSGYQVENGETFRAWYLFVLPRAVSRRQVRIGLDDAPSDDVPYPVRWVPEDSTTTS